VVGRDSEPYVHLARLAQRLDGSCEVLDIDGTIQRFGSYSEATLWLCEDEYAAVTCLIEEGDLPTSFAVPTGSATPEILSQMQNRGPELQPFLDRKFYESLGAERSGVACARRGCARGAVDMSTLCEGKELYRNVLRAYLPAMRPPSPSHRGSEGVPNRTVRQLWHRLSVRRRPTVHSSRAPRRRGSGLTGR
jgi:hypothetical protein